MTGAWPRPEVVPIWQGGFFCACHGSVYDAAQRVVKNVPQGEFNLTFIMRVFKSTVYMRTSHNVYYGKLPREVSGGSASTHSPRPESGNLSTAATNSAEVATAGSNIPVARQACAAG